MHLSCCTLGTLSATLDTRTLRKREPYWQVSMIEMSERDRIHLLHHDRHADDRPRQITEPKLQYPGCRVHDLKIAALPTPAVRLANANAISEPIRGPRQRKAPAGAAPPPCNSGAGRAQAARKTAVQANCRSPSVFRGRVSLARLFSPQHSQDSQIAAWCCMISNSPLLKLAIVIPPGASSLLRRHRPFQGRLSEGEQPLNGAPTPGSRTVARTAPPLRGGRVTSRPEKHFLAQRANQTGSPAFVNHGQHVGQDATNAAIIVVIAGPISSS